METRIENVVTDNGAKLEVATVVFEGKEFTNLGACVDLQHGIIHAYVGAMLDRDEKGVAYLPGRLFRLSSFAGEKLGEVHLVSKSRRIRTAWGSHIIEYYSMKAHGFHWHGKKGDGCDLIRLRRGKSVSS